jgi:hypothetical protein
MLGGVCREMQRESRAVEDRHTPAAHLGRCPVRRKLPPHDLRRGLRAGKPHVEIHRLVAVGVGADPGLAVHHACDVVDAERVADVHEPGGRQRASRSAEVIGRHEHVHVHVAARLPLRVQGARERRALEEQRVYLGGLEGGEDSRGGGIERGAAADAGDARRELSQRARGARRSADRPVVAPHGASRGVRRPRASPFPAGS